MIQRIIFLVKILIILFSSNLFANVDNKIVITVEDEIITSYEVKNKVLTSLFLAKQDINQTKVDQFKKQSIELLIQEKLKIIELKKLNIKADNLRINTYLNSISSNNIKSLKNSFKKNNLDFDLFKKGIETQFMWQEFIYIRYKDKINIDEEIINKELNKSLNSKKNIKEVKLSEIEIGIDENLTIEKEVERIKALIAKNGFANTAFTVSISPSAENKGELGWINSKSLSKKIVNIISKLKIGEISKPIISQNSILFLKLVDTRETRSEKVNLDEIKEKIINQKKNELFNLYSNSHLSKLRNTSFIEYK